MNSMIVLSAVVACVFGKCEIVETNNFHKKLIHHGVGEYSLTVSENVDADAVCNVVPDRSFTESFIANAGESNVFVSLCDSRKVRRPKGYYSCDALVDSSFKITCHGTNRKQ